MWWASSPAKTWAGLLSQVCPPPRLPPPSLHALHVKLIFFPSLFHPSPSSLILPQFLVDTDTRRRASGLAVLVEPAEIFLIYGFSKILMLDPWPCHPFLLALYYVDVPECGTCARRVGGLLPLHPESHNIGCNLRPGPHPCPYPFVQLAGAFPGTLPRLGLCPDLGHAADAGMLCTACQSTCISWFGSIPDQHVDA